MALAAATLKISKEKLKKWASKAKKNRHCSLITQKQTDMTGRQKQGQSEAIRKKQNRVYAIQTKE